MYVDYGFRKCVAFVLYRHKDGSVRFAGTAFFVQEKPDNRIGQAYSYMVTAMHVIDGIKKNSHDGKVILRLNLRNGGVDDVEVDAAKWVFQPKRPLDVDAAVLTWVPPLEIFDYEAIPEDLAVTEHMIKNDVIRIGDEVFVLGLFTQHSGKQKNIPIARVGNIAMLPEEPIPAKNFDPMIAYLIECHSVGGLSGSPVFVYHEESRTEKVPSGEITRRRKWLYWLGLIHGHYDVALPIEDDLIEDGPIEDIRRKGEVNMGIAAVVPASKILETVRQPKLLEEKEKELGELLKKNAPTEDSTDDPLPENDVFTRDVFLNTLKKVSRPNQPPPEEETSETSE